MNIQSLIVVELRLPLILSKKESGGKEMAVLHMRGAVHVSPEVPPTTLELMDSRLLVYQPRLGIRGMSHKNGTHIYKRMVGLLCRYIEVFEALFWSAYKKRGSGFSNVLLSTYWRSSCIVGKWNANHAASSGSIWSMLNRGRRRRPVTDILGWVSKDIYKRWVNSLGRIGGFLISFYDLRGRFSEESTVYCEIIKIWYLLVSTLHFTMRELRVVWLTPCDLITEIAFADRIYYHSRICPLLMHYFHAYFRINVYCGIWLLLRTYTSSSPFKALKAGLGQLK